MKPKVTYRLEPFNFWECGKIGLNITKNNILDSFYDLTLEEAKDLAHGLIAACLQFEEFEEQAREHDLHQNT